MPAQYTATIDPVIYSAACRDFTEADWIELAKAALDQASTRANRVAIRCALEHLEEIQQLEMRG